jgi:hypothetical protein
MPNVSPLRRPAALTALLLPGVFLFGHSDPVSAQAPSSETQILQAVQAAPAPEQANATVLGFGADGSVKTLREGSNDLVCLADGSLDPFMARGRELRAQGVTDSGELAQRRFAEADAGTLAMPGQPATLYVLHGEGWDETSESVRSPFLRWVIYTPWATTEQTGLPAAPTGPGAPWLMFPGTAGAHIMITPAPPGTGN